MLWPHHLRLIGLVPITDHRGTVGLLLDSKVPLQVECGTPYSNTPYSNKLDCSRVASRYYVSHFDLT